jgi:hypothetical protein
VRSLTGKHIETRNLTKFGSSIGGKDLLLLVDVLMALVVYIGSFLGQIVSGCERALLLIPPSLYIVGQVSGVLIQGGYRL